MALDPLANADGEIVTNNQGDIDPDGEFSLISLGDPALDRIWLRVTNMEAQLRRIERSITKIERRPTRAISLVLQGLAFIGGVAIMGWLINAFFR